MSNTDPSFVISSNIEITDEFSVEWRDVENRYRKCLKFQLYWFERDTKLSLVPLNEVCRSIQVR